MEEQKDKINSENFTSEAGHLNEPGPSISGTEKTTIPVLEEQIFITKEVVESGKVRISKTVQDITEMVNMPITHEEHDVKRVPVNKIITSPPPAMRHEGDTIIIPVLREELVVQKRLILVEEVHVTKRKIKNTIQQPVTLLKEQVVVEHIPNPTPNFPGDKPGDRH